MVDTVDLEELSADELGELITRATSVKSDKEYVAQFASMVSLYLVEYRRVCGASGHQDGAPWEAPSPDDLLTWYTLDERVSFEGRDYVSCAPFNTYPPDTPGAWKPAD